MAELLGTPEWLAITLFVVMGFTVLCTIASRNTNGQIKRTLTRRANLSRRRFIDAMRSDVSLEASEFIWESAKSGLDFFKQEITPHPDDNLVDDLPIDEEEWSIDWPVEWAAKQGFHSSNLPDWPAGWEPTIRNYGKWLDMGPEQ